MSTVVKRSRNLDPNDWMRKRFPAVFSTAHDDCFLYRKGGTAAFLSPYKAAECLGSIGSPDAPVRFSGESGKFFAYCPTEGIYKELSEPEVQRRIFVLLEECVREVGTRWVKAVRSVQKSSEAGPVTHALKGDASFPDPSRHRDLRYVHVENGVVDLDTLVIQDFSPRFRSSWKLPVPWLSNPPRAHRSWDMMERLFPEEDDRALAIELLASAFLGNPFQRFVLLTGAPNTGKTTLVRVLSQLLGPGASGGLRLRHAGSQFTPLSWAGRLLLYEPEAEQEDLDRGLEALKAISGHDPMTGERKYDPNLVEFTPTALPVLVSNNRMVRLNGGPSRKAVARRLVAFDVPEPCTPFKADPSFVGTLIKREGPAILKLLLTEAHRLRQQKKLRPLTSSQIVRNAGFLGLSDRLLEWAQQRITVREGESLTRDEAIASAAGWLQRHGLAIPGSTTAWSRRLKPIMETMGGTWAQSLRGDQKGWRGVALE